MILSVAFLTLLIGDFLSTFFYHVPEHVFGGFHNKVHHGKNKSFLHYAVLTKNPLVLVDGALGALPYFIAPLFLWSLSPWGVTLGLALGQAHVVWRHTTSIGWKTPTYWEYVCNMLWITTPERHWLHHQNGSQAFGDIFTFYEVPASYWLLALRKLKIYVKRNYRRAS